MSEEQLQSIQSNVINNAATQIFATQMPSVSHFEMPTLTEKQRLYIQKLGTTTGRKIVPIDLTLYRELMKLNLIEDKGRRVALTKLGTEVFRQLT